MIVDSLGTTLSGLFGTSAATTYIESASGIEAGAKSGTSSIICAFIFLPFLFLSPLISLIPAYATSPVLFVVGLSMVRGQMTDLKTLSKEEFASFFIALFMIPFTFSISNGVFLGVLSHLILATLTGHSRQIQPVTYIIGLLGLLHLLLAQ